MAKPTISYDDRLEAQIQTLIDAGVADNRSDFFRQAAQSHLIMLNTGMMGLWPAALDADDIDDIEAMRETLDDIAEDLHT